MHATSSIVALRSIREASGPIWTSGLADEVIGQFVASDSRLALAIQAAVEARRRMAESHAAHFGMAERDLCRLLQRDILNFYAAPSINPYVPIAAKGPWIVTTHGAVVHDSGGYGMLGLGHAPDAVLDAIGEPHVMANVMTPSFSQSELTERLTREIGRSRGACPFEKFIFLNSGSEAVTFTCRLADIHARRATDPGGRYAGRQSKRLAMVDSFHGRTEGPARLSDSCRPEYSRYLASFRDPGALEFIPLNDIGALRQALAGAAAAGEFFEAMFVEPVMGEGVPGLAMTPEFYAEARALTAEAGTLLVVDSIQAALRAHGCLSIVDYPGFESLAPPDMESYSKALNAGQFPLSVVALGAEVAASYVTGLYGNTMTANPRAMAVGCAVLDAVTDELRTNIRERGCEFRARLEQLGEEFPGAIDRVVGTGLMVSAMLNPERYRLLGEGGFEQYLRRNGIEMIHGGDTGLRFTPAFDITSAEIAMIIDAVRRGLRELA